MIEDIFRFFFCNIIPVLGVLFLGDVSDINWFCTFAFILWDLKMIFCRIVWRIIKITGGFCLCFSNKFWILIMENPFDESRLKRPTFLVVLCILTFIGSGWSVLSNLFSLFTADFYNGNTQMEQYSNMVGNMEDQGVSSFFSSFMNSSMELWQVTILHAKEIAMISLSLSVVSLIGAIVMFQLKRWGFYLYTASQVLMLFVLPYFAGFTIVVISSMLLSGIVTLLFIILYAVNLKYLR